MIGRLLKTYAYSKAPRSTFALRHPIAATKLYAYGKAPVATFALTHPRTAARLAKMRWDFRHAYAPRVAAIGAAAIALPLGLALGRARRNGHAED